MLIFQGHSNLNIWPWLPWLEFQIVHRSVESVWVENWHCHTCNFHIVDNKTPCSCIWDEKVKSSTLRIERNKKRKHVIVLRIDRAPVYCNPCWWGSTQNNLDGTFLHSDAGVSDSRVDCPDKTSRIIVTRLWFWPKQQENMQHAGKVWCKHFS